MFTSINKPNRVEPTRDTSLSPITFSSNEKLSEFRQSSLAQAASLLDIPGYPYVSAVLSFFAQDDHQNISRLLQLNDYFHLSTGSWEGYSVIRHTDLVLSQASKYPFILEFQEKKDLNSHISPEEFAALLLFHDLNKLPESKNGDSVAVTKEAQHQRSSQLLIDFQDVLGISDSTLKLMLKVLETEVLGKVISKIYPWRPSPQEKTEVRENLLAIAASDPNKAYSVYQETVALWQDKAVQSLVPDALHRQILEEAKDQILCAAREVNVDPKEFLFYLTAYFQRDISAYAYDAVSVDERGSEYRAFPATDLLFERRKDVNCLVEPQFIYDQKLQRLKFSPPFESVFLELEEMLST